MKNSNLHGTISNHSFYIPQFGKKMDVAKVGTVLENLKMDPNDPVNEFKATMNANFSQLRELIPYDDMGYVKGFLPASFRGCNILIDHAL